METIYADWRLPTIQELLTLVDYTRVHPASIIVDRNAFETCWSSTPHANPYVEGYWSACFGTGSTSVCFISHGFYVRAVRKSSKGSLQWTTVSSKPMQYKEAEQYVKSLCQAPNYKEL